MPEVKNAKKYSTVQVGDICSTQTQNVLTLFALTHRLVVFKMLPPRQTDRNLHNIKKKYDTNKYKQWPGFPIPISYAHLNFALLATYTSSN